MGEEPATDSKSVQSLLEMLESSVPDTSVLLPEKIIVVKQVISPALMEAASEQSTQSRMQLLTPLGVESGQKVQIYTALTVLASVAPNFLSPRGSNEFSIEYRIATSLRSIS